MRKLNDGGSNDGDVMEEILRRQIFNWLPGGMATEYQCLQPVQILSRTDVGLLWNCKMVEEDVLQVHLSWDDVQLGREQASVLLGELVDVAERMAKEENWEKGVERL
jgi:hypothetical protein